MLQNKNTLSSKDQLAKLMATEDITVQHSQSAKTASFDVKYRVLTLPNWEASTTDITDLLIGHEVAHALWTLEKDWEHALFNNLHKGITNVVEDARIERRIKAKYPGLVKIMVRGYRELEKRRFFYEEPSDIDSMNFIDRVNLHCKLGPLAAIPFTDIELPYVEMVENTSSWGSVETCVKLIMDFMGSEEYKEQQQQRMENAEGFGMDGEEEDGGDDLTDDWEDNGEEEEEGGQTPHSAEESSDDKSSEITVETQERFDDSVESELSSKENDNYEIHYFSPPRPKMENLLIGYKAAHAELVKTFDDQNRAREAYWKNNTHLHSRKHIFDEVWDLGPGEFTKFRRDAQKIVGYMAKEFERKKSAAEYRKESVSKTGVLDMTKVHQYKYNDDLFLRNTIRPDGKSHGLVMLFDWSASMTEHLHDTMKQTLALAWFCSKVNVPFEVYAFTNSWGKDTDPKESRYVWETPKAGEAYFDRNGRDGFNLINILSSRMNSKMLLDQSRLLFTMSNKYRAGRSFGDWGRYELSSTPLCEALCAMQNVLPAFKSKQKLDIVNMIILTDGEGNGRWRGINLARDENDKFDDVHINFWGAGRYNDYRMADPITKKVYSFKDIIEEMPGDRYYDNAVEETAILKMLKDRYDINVIGLFLDGRSNGKSLRNKTLEKYLGYKRWNYSKHFAVRAEVKKNGVGTVFFPGHDEYYLVPVGSIQEEENVLEIDSDWTAGKIKNAFKKNLNKKFGNKVLVNKMMDIIA